MEALILAGLSAGVVVVILCTSTIAEPIRRIPYLSKVLECTFCTSIWVSLAFSFPHWQLTLAVAAIANITVLLTHWSIATVEDE